MRCSSSHPGVTSVLWKPLLVMMQYTESPQKSDWEYAITLGFSPCISSAASWSLISRGILGWCTCPTSVMSDHRFGSGPKRAPPVKATQSNSCPAVTAFNMACTQSAGTLGELRKVWSVVILQPDGVCCVGSVNATQRIS